MILARHDRNFFSTTDYATKAGAYMYLADIAKEQGDLVIPVDGTQLLCRFGHTCRSPDSPMPLSAQ